MVDPSYERQPAISTLIWSNEHRAWWKAGRSGYTRHVREAGVYSLGDAIEICRDARGGWIAGNAPPEIPVRRDDVLSCDVPRTRHGKK